jgi:phospholipid/cholesterol/gamma-HCH transport system ATP-binding protein
MIRVSNLTKAYDEDLILANINLQVSKGEVLALIGFSGSGKSTLLKIIAGLEDYQGGSIELNSNKLGMAFQYSALFDSLTVAENIAFPLLVGEHLKKLPEQQFIDKLIADKLQLVGMQGIETCYPSELSGGMKKRVSFARAIINDPEIILFDEPTAGLDPVASTIIEDLMVRLQQSTGAASIVVTHQASTIKRAATRVAMLYNSKIVWEGSPQELFDDANDNQFARQFREGSVSGPMAVNQ